MSKWHTLLLLSGLVLLPAPAFAMHISEGILPAPWAGLWLTLSIPFVFWGLRQVKTRSALDAKSKALVALVGSAVFIISCMPVPVPTAGTCSHPCGTGLAAILIGPGPTFVVTSVALLLQALFLAHGGLTTLGADIVSMGVVGGLAGYGVFRVLRGARVSPVLAAFVGGVLSDWATYTTTSFQLASALHGSGSLWAMFVAILVAFIPTQLPLGIFEGFLAAGAYRFIRSRRPELLEPLAVRVREQGAEA